MIEKYFPEPTSIELEQNKSADPENNEADNDKKLDEIDSLLEQLPKELQDHWYSYVEKNSIDDALEKIRSAVFQRQEVINGVKILSVNKREGGEVLEQNIRAEMQDISLALHDPSCFLGEGQVAKVVRSPKIDHLCYKIVHNMASYRQGNNIHQEGAFLEDLEGFEIDGVRTPLIYFYIDQVDALGFGMETLDAVSVVDVFNQPDLLLELRARKFDVEAFIESLKKYIAEMHKKGIFHRDLFSRNVMIDWETLKPRVIDFGKAKKTYFESEIGSSDIADWEGIKVIRKNLWKAWNGESIDFSINV